MKRTAIFMSILFVVSMALASFVYTQTTDNTVTGMITDDQKVPLIGVNIMVKGTSIGTVSDIDGSYSITFSEGRHLLVFSYTGLSTQEIEYTGQNTIDVTLEQGILCNEIVVTEKKSIFNKLGKLFSKDKVRSASIQNVSPALCGKSQAVTIRGYSESEDVSWTNTNYHIDGVEIAREQSDKDELTRMTDPEGSETYRTIIENTFIQPKQKAISTFSIDVDRASYCNVRRYVENGGLPPSDAVRVEELLNYFSYDYPQPDSNVPFALYTELSSCPWNNEHQLLRVGVQGKTVDIDELPPSNLVFLVDVSGSMGSPNKLPLVKKSLRYLVSQMRQEDYMSLVVYAGAAGVVLMPTSGKNKDKINKAISNLRSGGSTAGAAGIELAYDLAKKTYREQGNNRVILATDGDFNVGVSSDAGLVQLIEKKRNDGIFLSVLGFGMGNYQDSKMQQLADSGNGNHAYIDDMKEAKKLFGTEFGGTLFTIAKDVKIQIGFNDEKVSAYRLIGYENRLLTTKDFDDDAKDAGELGSGHSVTALYEIIPAGVENDFIRVDKSSDIEQEPYTPYVSGELASIKLRYKQPTGNVSRLIESSIAHTLSEPSADQVFAGSVAEYGLVLRNSMYKGSANIESSISAAKVSIGSDKTNIRKDFIELLKQSQKLYDGLASK